MVKYEGWESSFLLLCLVSTTAVSSGSELTKPGPQERGQDGPGDSSIWQVDTTFKTGGRRSRWEPRLPKERPSTAWDLFLGKSANETIPERASLETR